MTKQNSQIRPKGARYQLVTSLIIAASFACTPSPERKVVAEVNGEKIITMEFEKALSQEKTGTDPDLWNDPRGLALIKKKVLDQLIENHLLRQEVRRRKITIAKEELQKEVGRLKAGYDNWEFHEALRKEGLTEEQWLEKIRQNLLLSRLTEQVLSERHPEEKGIEAEYRKNISRYQEPERSHCRQIVASTREKAEKILELLKSGENFAALATKFSESPDREKGGDLGFVARDDLPPILDGACFRFQPGQTSGVVASAYGFHIFRVIERKPLRTLTLEEARPQVEAEWREKNQKEILKKWMKELHERSKIEIKP